MKVIYCVFAFFFLGVMNVASVAQSCCAKAGVDFKLLAMNADFKDAHLAPEPFEYVQQSGEMVSFNAPDGKQGSAYFVPSKKATNKVLLVFHEWWGLNDYIKREADRLQSELGDIDVYAVDLYDGKVANDPETASKLAGGLDKTRGENIIKGLLEKIGRDKKIATIGWCMGGSWSFTGTLLADKQAIACVMYYGFPEKDAERIKTLKTDVLYNWGSKDKFIKKEYVDAFGESVKAAGHKFEFHAFDADHAFANPSNPKYDKAAAAEAEGYAMKFLRKKLK